MRQWEKYQNLTFLRKKNDKNFANYFLNKLKTKLFWFSMTEITDHLHLYFWILLKFYFYALQLQLQYSTLHNYNFEPHRCRKKFPLSVKRCGSLHQPDSDWRERLQNLEKIKSLQSMRWTKLFSFPLNFNNIFA